MRMRMIVLGAIAALAAMALPSSASAKAHLLKLYKVEKHVDLTGQDDIYTVTCPDGDLALDGMWRIDNVDQDNDYTYDPFPTGNPGFDVLRSVRPTMSRATSDSSFDFSFTPLSGGDVQIKLWVTCLGKKTSPNGHFVTWDIVPGGSTSVDDTAMLGSGTATGACPNGIVVQPGFQVMAGDADLVTSRPTSPADTTWQWRWDFVGVSPFQANLYWNCLDLRSNPAPDGHRHRIVKQFRSNDPGAPYNSTISSSPPLILHHAVREATLHCGDHYKGMIGGWNHGFGHAGYGFLWYLGMDPRIKSRSFKWINAHGVNDYRPDLYLVCFKDKTT